MRGSIKVSSLGQPSCEFYIKKEVGQMTYVHVNRCSVGIFKRILEIYSVVVFQMSLSFKLIQEEN